jgi:hypothetical protein
MMKKNKRSRGVFLAGNDIDEGRLPKRKDALLYINYLRETLGYFIKQNVRYEDELIKRGWEPSWKNWKPASDGAIWTHVSATGEEEPL